MRAESANYCYFCGMKLHIFNPEHDMAFASDDAKFIAPHMVCCMRRDLGFMPALWADDGDVVVVDDVGTAKNALRHIKRNTAKVEFLCVSDLCKAGSLLSSVSSIEPWGWDAAVRRLFLQADRSFEPLLPSVSRLSEIRRLSGRRFSAECLRTAICRTDERFVGEGETVTELARIEELMANGRRWVLKSPWSSSGRGIRYIEKRLSAHEKGWCRNVISNQGYLMAEPYYEKIVDFGMEFSAEAGGNVCYHGLSVFATRNRAYAGNILATERAKQEILGKYIDVSILDSLKEEIIKQLQPLLSSCYSGPFGVDMMIVGNAPEAGFRIHPCVELNLRRTMGHVALAVSGDEATPQAMMNIDYDGRFHFRIRPTNENIVNTSIFA